MYFDVREEIRVHLTSSVGRCITNTAQLFDTLATESVLEIILTLWASIYTSLSNILVLDDGSQSRAGFVEICKIYYV